MFQRYSGESTSCGCAALKRSQITSLVVSGTKAVADPGGHPQSISISSQCNFFHFRVVFGKNFAE